MKRTGELLKKAREQKGLSINEIGLSLKISSKILKAIEEGDLAQLPAKTFLRGFVQSYASYLRLDVNEILKIFQDEMGSTRPSPLIHMPERDETLESSERNPTGPSTKSVPSSEKPLNSLTKKNSSRTVTLTILGFVLVTGIIFTKKMIDKYQKEGTISEVEITTPLLPSQDSAPTPPSTTPAAAGGTVPMSTPLQTPTPTMTPAPAASLKPTTTPAPAITPKPTVTPTVTPTPTPTPDSTPTASPAPSPNISPSPLLSKPVEVIVEALDAVEISFTTKDGKTEKVSLSAEQIHTFKSKSGLILNISNGGAVNVIVNGKDLGIPGNLGKPVKLNY